MPDSSSVPAIRFAIYARYPSTLQNPRSTEDQIRLCRQRAGALGGAVTLVFEDAAVTATTIHNRPALMDLPKLRARPASTPSLPKPSTASAATRPIPQPFFASCAIMASS